MAQYTIVCVDGLAGNPEITFRNVKKQLIDHVVHLVDTVGVQTIAERVQRVQDVVHTIDTDIILIGLSAGAFATSEVARVSKKIKGIVLLSPAMAARYVYFTPQLVKVFGAVAGKVYTGKEIMLSPEQYRMLIEPIRESVVEMFIQHRIPFCGKEALPLLKPRAITYEHSCPTLYIYGNNDRMLAPRAHRKHVKSLQKHMQVIAHEIPNTGHLVLESEEESVLSLIQDFINAL